MHGLLRVGVQRWTFPVWSSKSQAWVWLEAIIPQATGIGIHGGSNGARKTATERNWRKCWHTLSFPKYSFPVFGVGI